jgi:hypothetical protein
MDSYKAVRNLAEAANSVTFGKDLQEGPYDVPYDVPLPYSPLKPEFNPHFKPQGPMGPPAPPPPPPPLPDNLPKLPDGHRWVPNPDGSWRVVPPLPNFNPVDPSTWPPGFFPQQQPTWA